MGEAPGIPVQPIRFGGEEENARHAAAAQRALAEFREFARLIPGERDASEHLAWVSLETETTHATIAAILAVQMNQSRERAYLVNTLLQVGIAIGGLLGQWTDQERLEACGIIGAGIANGAAAVIQASTIMGTA